MNAHGRLVVRRALATALLASCVPARAFAADSSPDGGEAKAATEPREAERTDGGEKSPWEFAATAGVPKLASDQFAFSGDADVGYVFGSWSLDGRFATSTYAMSAPGDSFSSTSRTQMLLGATISRGAADAKFDLQGRLELEYASYSTTFVSTAPGGDFNAEASGMSRASALAGASFVPSDRLSMLLRGGLGLQSEVYTQSNVDSASFNTSSSSRILGRARARYALVPGEWALRSTLRFDLYSLRRSDIFVDEETDPALAGSPDLVKERKGIDVGLRAFADWEKVNIIGLTPGLMVGVDYTAVRGDGGNVSAFTPLAGIGLVDKSQL